MNIQQFLEHHGVSRNPFAEEDAQTDPVFKDFCIESTYHPTWDKVYGDPAEPATAVVFGEKGAGKTAMRLQIARHLKLYNREHPGERTFGTYMGGKRRLIDPFLHFLAKNDQHHGVAPRRVGQRYVVDITHISDEPALGQRAAKGSSAGPDDPATEPLGGLGPMAEDREAAIPFVARE